MSTEIAIPFRVDSSGRVVTVSDPDALVRQHVLALINTRPHERAMVPGYGVDTAGLLFEDADSEDIAASAANIIGGAMSQWEPGVDVARVEMVTEDELVRLDVEYSRKDAPDSGTIANANEAIIGANGTVREIVRG